ncbi:type II toxin-antitoxin system VapC family toxin [Ciceribacter selenitireducens]|jgi:PIN domain nuclease of toxin-antitoxin system|nr:type II toxin-antitoxin system VapC family toxin [Ciceribacter selenitireducens]
MSSGFLLDTCFVIWMSRQEMLAPLSLEMLAESRVRAIPSYVSTATAWEMAMLLSKGRIRETRDVDHWYRDFLRDGGFAEQPVTARTFMASCFLPQPIHNDPIDRILIATARENDLTIITRDRAILSYGALGHVKVLAC